MNASSGGCFDSFSVAEFTLDELHGLCRRGYVLIFLFSKPSRMSTTIFILILFLRVLFRFLIVDNFFLQVEINMLTILGGWWLHCLEDILFDFTNECILECLKLLFEKLSDNIALVKATGVNVRSVGRILRLVLWVFMDLIIETKSLSLRWLNPVRANALGWLILICNIALPFTRLWFVLWRLCMWTKSVFVSLITYHQGCCVFVLSDLLLSNNNGVRLHVAIQPTQIDPQWLLWNLDSYADIIHWLLLHRCFILWA